MEMLLTTREGFFEKQVCPLARNPNVEDRVGLGFHNTCVSPQILSLGNELLTVVRTQGEQNSPEE